MALKIVLLLAMVALAYGVPAIQSAEDSQVNSEAGKVGGMETIEELIARGAQEGVGNMIIQFDNKEPASVQTPQGRSFCAFVNVRVGGAYLRVYRCW